jgi:hypothetical protein
MPSRSIGKKRSRNTMNSDSCSRRRDKISRLSSPILRIHYLSSTLVDWSRFEMEMPTLDGVWLSPTTRSSIQRYAHPPCPGRSADKQGRPPIVTDADPPQKHYIVDVLIKVASDSVVEKKTTSSGLSPPPAGDAGRVVIIGVLLSTVQAISQLRIKLPQDLRSQEQKNTAYKAIGEIKKRMPNGPALLDPIKNMGINDKSFRDLIKVCRNL